MKLSSFADEIVGMPEAMDSRLANPTPRPASRSWPSISVTFNNSIILSCSILPKNFMLFSKSNLAVRFTGASVYTSPIKTNLASGKSLITSGIALIKLSGFLRLEMVPTDSISSSLPMP